MSNTNTTLTPEQLLANFRASGCDKELFTSFIREYETALCRYNTSIVSKAYEERIAELNALVQSLEFELRANDSHYATPPSQISRDELHNKAWQLYRDKVMDDSMLKAMNIHSMRTIFNCIYEALQSPTNSESPSSFSVTGSMGDKVQTLILNEKQPIAAKQPEQVRDDCINDTDRLNYVASNFHYLGFTDIGEAWIVFHEEDRRRVSSMREAIDIMLTLHKLIKMKSNADPVHPDQKEKE